MRAAPVTDFDTRARVLKAMAHPSRLAMIAALEQGERCVCELQAVVGADMSTVSKHLALMRAAGLVTDRKQGLQVFYSLRVPCVLHFFDCVDAVLTTDRRASGRRPEAAKACPSCRAFIPLAPRKRSAHARR